MRYDEYLLALADDLGCECRWIPGGSVGMMYVEFGYVETPHPYDHSLEIDQQAFAVGLHELGHVELGHTQGRPPCEDQRFYFDNGVLHSEAQAWEYALDHFEKVGEEIDPKTRNFMWNRCLGSYYLGSRACQGQLTRLGNGDRGHVAFVYDEPDGYFWAVKDRITGI